MVLAASAAPTSSPAAIALSTAACRAAASGNVLGFTLVHKIKSPRQRIDRRKRVGDERIARAGNDEALGLEMHAKEFHHVDRHAGFHEGIGDLGQISPFIDGGAAGRARRDQRFELPPQLQHQHLLVRIDIGYSNAVPADDRDQPLPGQPLQRFPDRRPADPDAVAQHGFGPQAPRRQLQRDNQLFEFAMGDIGQPVRTQFRSARGRWRRQIRHPRRGDRRAALGRAAIVGAAHDVSVLKIREGLAQ